MSLIARILAASKAPEKLKEILDDELVSRRDLQEALISAAHDGLPEVMRILLTPCGAFGGLTAADCRARNNEALKMAVAAHGVKNDRKRARMSAEMVRLLLAAGLTPEDCRIDNNFPLRYAAARGHVETAQLLLAHGLTVEDCCSEELAVFRHAHPQEKIHVLRLLLAPCGAFGGLTAGNLRENTNAVLYAAAVDGNECVLRELLEFRDQHGDCLGREDILQAAALETAVDNGHLEAVEVLRQYVEEDDINSFVLGRAANTSLEMLGALDLQPIRYHNPAVVMAAVSQRRTEMLEWLWRRGVHCRGWVPALHHALIVACPPVLEWLWEHGVTIADCQVWPGFAFCLGGWKSTAGWDWLIARGFDQDATKPAAIGFLLMQGLRENSFPVLEWLWDRGHIDSRAFMLNNYEALKLAADMCAPETLDWLLARLPRGYFEHRNNSLLRAAVSRRHPVVGWLLSRGFGLRVGGRDLVRAAEEGCVQRLICAGMARGRRADPAPWMRAAKRDIKIVMCCLARLEQRPLPQEMWQYIAQFW